MSYDRRAAEAPTVEADEVGEVAVADYIVFLLAFDTYKRWLTESHLDLDPHAHKALTLIKSAEQSYKDGIIAEINKDLPTASHKKLLVKAFSYLTTPDGLSRRALMLRTTLSKGGAGTMRAVFQTNRALLAVREAVQASMIDDADAALDKFAVIGLRNSRFRGWIDRAAELAGPGLPQNPVAVSSEQTSDNVHEILAARIQQQGGSVSSVASGEAATVGRHELHKVQAEATEAAKKAMGISGEDDVPPTKSDVVGIATAAAVAAASDPARVANIPEPLRRLDDEQRAASMTDGKVLVAAGAGAGKSTTLVSRVAYLVKDRHAAPGKILVTSFNTKAANELKSKIGKAVGDDAFKQMTVGTMHSLFRRFIGEYGTPSERSAVGLNEQANGFMKDGAAIAGAVTRAWKQIFAGTKQATPPKTKNAMRYKAQWAGNNVSPKQAQERAITDDEALCAIWYEMYEGFKGNPPNWKPSKPCKEWEAWLAKKRPGGIRLGDFDDMLSIFRDILKRDPNVRRKVQSMYDHLMVDECQDLNEIQSEIIEMMSGHIGDGKDGKSLWMVGDDKQCPSSDTPILTPHGEVLAKDLQTGGEVIAWRNGKLVPQKVVVSPSDWTWGYKITTSSGRSLTISPSHKIWASPPILEPHQVAVYLMFRQDMGFRIGITNKGQRDADYLNSLAGRAFQEKAEKMWVLSIHGDREDAKLEETILSLQYGIPQLVFNGVHRGLNQDRIDKTFEKCGRNGLKLLEERHLNADLPHWVSKGYAKHGRERRVVQLLAHAPKFSLVRFEWSDNAEGVNPLEEALAEFTYETTGRGRYRLRKGFTNYREAQTFAVALARKAGALINHTLSTPEGPLQKVTASALLVGMKVPVRDEDTLLLEDIVSVERVDGTFVSLEVDDASNFFGGGILSHNSIYGFRGARPDLFTGLDGKEGWKTRQIRTNYRCAPEIVGAANKLISHNKNQIKMEANPDPRKVSGVASIKVKKASDEAEGALGVIEKIKSDSVAGGDVADNAVLTRTNRELHAYETACIIRGVPYARKGSGSFLGSPETKTFLSYVQLVTGDDFKKMQESLKEIINKPNRFFITPERGAEAVEAALTQFALQSGQDRKVLNPIVALSNVGFRRQLAQQLVGSPAGFKFNKALETLEDIYNQLTDLRAASASGEISTKEIFDEVLNFRGTAGVTDPRTGETRYVEQTFRESLQQRAAESVGDDDDAGEDDETEAMKGLGNIAFLYELAKKDPTSPEEEVNPPSTPLGFKSKMERMAGRMRDLRIDLDKWEKEQQALPAEQRKPPPGVYLGTAHSTKGAQWNNCYVQMPKGKFPMPFIWPKDAPPPPDELVQAHEESERRLGYVALTRAAKNLTVVCPDSVGGKPAGVSEYVAESGLSVGENVKPTSPKTASEYDGLVPDEWTDSTAADITSTYKRD